MEPRSSEISAAVPAVKLNELIAGVPFSTYTQSEGINASGLKNVLRSPAHYFEYRYNRVQEKETPALQFGKLFHYAVLEPELFHRNYVIQPKFDKRTKTGKEAHELWQTTLTPDSIVVPEEFVSKLLKMTEKILAHRTASKILTEGLKETTMFWIDPDTGELCKMRPDFVSSRWGIVDLKSSIDAREDAFRADIRKYDYDVQVGHYCAGAKATGVCRSDVFTFIVVEKDPPHEIAVYPAGASVLARGDRQREKAMKIYAECRKTNQWPGYNPSARVIEHPDWLMANELYEE